MSNVDLVSVIIPSYNASSYIVEAVESVLHQTYRRIEIIVVDDGSVDNTRLVLADYVRSNLIRYVYQNNAGASVARNKGIGLATGRYIAFLDADDYWRKDKIECQVAEMRRTGSAISFSNCTNIDSTGHFLSKTNNTFSINRKEMVKNIYLSKVKSITPSIVVDRSIVSSDLLGFNQTLRHREDSLFVLKIVSNYDFCFVNDSLFYRREHGESLRTTLSYRTTILANFHFMRVAEQELPELIKYKERFKSAIFFAASKQALAQSRFHKSGKLSLISFRLFPNLSSLLLFVVSFLRIDFFILKKVYRKLNFHRS